jgi:recombination protein RecR
MSRSLDHLVSELSKLPGIGGKSAERLAYHLLKREQQENEALAGAIATLKKLVRPCRKCGNHAEADLCEICSDPKRDSSLLCIVEEAKDIRIFERLKVFKGLYHVLGGVISPLHGVGPEDLSIDPLLDRVGTGEVREVIIALSQTTEGELTGLYVNRMLQKKGVKVTKLLAGIPVGSDLEYVDILTLSRSFEGRQDF